MADPKEIKEISDVAKVGELPLVFISHDTRDAELAEAFSKLLKSVSAGMLKSFRSSDRKGTEGIEFGDEWYKTLMSKLDSASDVVCLLTERSIDRPWILYEAGVAKGKLGTPVHGIAIGVPLSRVGVGPFYQFQNSDDSEDSLSKLVIQLCRRVPGLEPDSEVVKSQVQVFKSKAAEALKSLGSQTKVEKKDTHNEGAVAKVLEEMKLIVRELPLRIEQQVAENPERFRSPRFHSRRLNPMVIVEMAHMMSKRRNDPIFILMIASLFRNDFPWVYEIGVDAYKTAKSGNIRERNEAFKSFRDAVEYTTQGPFANELGMASKEIHMMFSEVSILIDQFAHEFSNKPANNSRSFKKVSVVQENEIS